MVGAIPDDAQIFTGNAAHKVAAGDLANAMAILDDTGDGVHAGNTGHLLAAGNRSGEGTIQNLACVLTGNAAHRILTAAGLHSATHR